MSTQTIPPRDWLALSGYERDILRYLVNTSPKSGAELHDALGGVTGRNTPKPVYTHLQRLREQGYLEKHPRDEKTDEYTTTTKAYVLLDKVEECYD